MFKFLGNMDFALGQLKTPREIMAGQVQGAPPARPGRTRDHSVYAQSQTIYSQPQFYSPLHTPQNWQIPQKRRDMYQWIRYWVDNEPKVAAAIDFYSSFPMNGFETQCPNFKVKRYFDNLNKKLNLDKWSKYISREFHMLGDVFPFLEVQCDECHGSGLTPDGDLCQHPGGYFRRLVILNPDSIEVQKSSMVEDPVITLLPDDELRKVIWTKKPKDLYDRLPLHIRQLVLSNKPIPLANECISHLTFNPYPYGVYGTSIIRRLFKTLSYKDKLMTAQWITAERLILPIRVVKVGDAERPASTTDIAAVQQQLAQVANDPNLTLVTHHAFEYEWFGAAGKVLTLSNEYELINKEILQGLMINEALLSGEMSGYACHDEKTRVLTKDGLKFYDDVTDDDEIASYDRVTGEMTFEKPLARHSYDFDGEMVHFQTNRIDIAVTENHKMLFKPRNEDNWVVGPASEVGARCYFKNTVKWSGDRDYPCDVVVGDVTFPIRQYLEIGAFYVTEGYVQKETRKERSTYGDPMCLRISQSPKGKAWKDMLRLKDDCVIKMSKYKNNEFAIHNKDVAVHFAKEFGSGSYEKKIPSWVKNLPIEFLEELLQNMIKGDGALRCRAGLVLYSYYTVSERLMQDVVEIALKCGYFPRIRRIERKNPKWGNGKTWVVMFGSSDKRSDSISVESKKHQVITRMPYKGKVWCFTTRTGFFVTERNGRLAIQGNSAAIGAEALIQRLESWRLELARWIEDKIYKQVAKMQGFIDHEASKEFGEEIYIYPKIHWNDLNLRDDTQQKQLWMQLHSEQILSTQTLCEKFNIDYDTEIEKVRLEQARSAGPAGAAGGGVPPGGVPMGGGGGGGGMPPMGGDMGGGGAPPMGGDMGGMGDMGGGAAPAAPPAEAPATAGTGGKILSKGKKKMMKLPAEEEVQPAGIKLTSLEQAMYKILENVRVPFQKWIQYPLGPYKADFAIPQLKLDIECDGTKWHTGPDAVARDKKRDTELAGNGWTVLRFGEVDLKENQSAVENTINAYVYKLWKKALDQQRESVDKKAEALGDITRLASPGQPPATAGSEAPIENESEIKNGRTDS